MSTAFGAEVHACTSNMRDWAIKHAKDRAASDVTDDCLVCMHRESGIF